MSRRIAIVGAGISGLGAAWALRRDHDVTIFEADQRLGGHSNTVDVRFGDGTSTAVDTGFIVYNEVTYPHLTRLFDALGVPTEASDMSFSFAVPGRLEYGASLRGLIAHPTALLRSRYRRMIRDILRFRRVGSRLLEEANDEELGPFLRSHGFSTGFVDDYLLPMTGAIWSARRRDIRRHPAGPMLRFLHNHGLIEVVGRPRWRTVTGGSRQYVQRLAASLPGAIRLGKPAVEITRPGDAVTIRTPVAEESFDELILAVHSDQAIGLLGGDATDAEREALGAIRYEPNRAVLHSDESSMPGRRSVWSSWNSRAGAGDREDRRASVTYWMNRLQNLDTPSPLFVTLNPLDEPDPALVHAEFEYAHPQFDAGSVAAQRAVNRLQGNNRTWFAGAWLGYGFHEDGLQSGLNVAAALGSRVPWFDSVTPKSSALAIRELTP